MPPLAPQRAAMLAVAERLYRFLLVCMPRAVRRQHGEEMACLFRDKLRAALRQGSAWRGVAVAMRGMADLLVGAMRERFGSLAAGPPGASPRYGSPSYRKEPIMSAWTQDLRFATRLLRKQPAVSALIVLTLALGIGANTTVFSFVKAVFLNPLPVADVATLVAVFGTVGEGDAPGLSVFPVSWPNYRDLRARNRSLAGLAGYGFAQAGLADDAGEPQFEPAQLVSANYFDVLGVQPAAGRFFLPGEEEPVGAHAVVVISHALWQERYAGVDVLGRAVRINGHPFTIVGVAPEGFGGTDALFDVRLWAPISMHPQMHSYSEFVEERRWRMFQMVGRLREGVTAEQAGADLRNVSLALEEEFPDDNRGRLARVVPLAQATIDPNQRDDYVRSSLFLLAVTGVVLLIACANVANLMLARARGRNREIAVRLSLGAGRWRVIRQLACEGLLLAGLGGIVSVLVAVAGRDLLWAYRPPFLSETLEIGVDLRVLGVTAALALATGMAFALAPALRAARVDAATTLRESGVTAGDRRGRLPLRSALVVAQVALSFLAVVGAGLFLSSLREAQRIDPGFPAGELLLVPLNPAAQAYPQERAQQFYEEVVAQLEALPGIEQVGIASNPPLTPTFLSRTTMRVGDSEEQATLIGSNSISPGFFDAMGIPLIAGRGFRADDRAEMRGVIVVNDVMARLLWPDEEPVGRRVRFLGETEPFEVVGVVGSIKYNTLGEAPQPYFYHPLRQRYADAVTVHVRTSGPPSEVAEAVRAAIHDLDPGLPLADMTTAAEQIAQSLWAPRMAASLLTVFGALSLALALVGIYGVLVQLIGERRREIGIRMALGAGRSDVLSLVGKQTMRWVLAGGAIGVAAALLASRWLGSFLYEISATDPLTYVVTAAVLLLAALLAAGLPARRAAAVDPAMTMRQE